MYKNILKEKNMGGDTMRLNSYFKDLKDDIFFKDIKDDSRLVKKNDLFFAIKGDNFDGEKYISEAIDNGASFIISKRNLVSYPSLTTPNPKELLNSMLNFYYNKHQMLHNIAVTGTDGKTTTSYLINHVLNDVSRSILIGTNGIYFLKRHFKLQNTTPSNSIIYEALDNAYLYKAQYSVIEMSSEGILNNRGLFLSFNGLIFTNISHEHLNTHKTMKRYLNCKLSLNKCLRPNSLILINYDMNYYAYVRKRLKGHIMTYGLNGGDFQAKNIRISLNRTIFDVYYMGYFLGQIITNLFGEYNVYNLLASIGYLYEMGIPFSIIKKSLSQKLQVEGRFELIKDKDKFYIIDFAHTPYGVKATLEALNKVKKGRIISILGCQGNKDKSKRPLMGKFATSLSDITIFTSEDPKDEKITSILADMTKKAKNSYYLSLYRDEAIRLGVSLMQDNDILIIFGKGRENTERYGNYIFYHSDLKLLKEALKT